MSVYLMFLFNIMWREKAWGKYSTYGYGTTVNVWPTNLTQNQASIPTGKLPEVFFLFFFFFLSPKLPWVWSELCLFMESESLMKTNIEKRNWKSAELSSCHSPCIHLPSTFMPYWWFHNGHPRIQNQREYMSIIGSNLPSLSKLLTLKALEEWLLFCFTFHPIVLDMVTN